MTKSTKNKYVVRFNDPDIDAEYSAVFYGKSDTTAKHYLESVGEDGYIELPFSPPLNLTIITNMSQHYFDMLLGQPSNDHVSTFIAYENATAYVPTIHQDYNLDDLQVTPA